MRIIQLVRSQSDVRDEDDLLKLFDQFSSLMLPMSHWLELDTAVISESSLSGKSAMYEHMKSQFKTQ